MSKEWEDRYTDACRQLADMSDRNRELTRQVEQLQADAERYRYIRNRQNIDIGSCWFLPNEAPVPTTPEGIGCGD